MTQLEISFPAASRQEAYDKINETSATKRQQVLDILKTHGPQTADEIAVFLNQPPYTIRPRLTELKEGGLIVTVGRAEGMTGLRITLWKAA